ncbi:MAG: hydrogenase maturation nickel metallochaperone HypA [Chloroflexi bacterium RBG_13_46_14]|nr:MAG: hydrogenase maturation nickel metallochaperone HypA [Chloroflexi bacterium RBG_13_46_14]
MHELSIVESLLALVLEHAGKAEAEKVVGVNLVVGELSGVVQEAVKFYWDFLTRETIAKDSRIIFRHVPAQLKCRECGEVFLSSEYGYVCPKCRNQKVDIIAGRELFIDSLEVE